MDIEHFAAFVAVAEERHFGRAAAKLHISQPPLSRRIQRLEHELGVQLFDRTTRSVALTPAGEALIGVARDAVRAGTRAKRIAELTASGDVGHVRVAFAGTSTHRLVGRLAREIRRRAPGLTLELLSQQFARPALELVIREEVDLALGRWDAVPAEIDSRLLATEQIVVAVPSSHAIAQLESVDFEALADVPFISIPRETGSVLWDRFRELSRATGIEPEVVQVVPDTWTAMALVAAEVGASLTVSSVEENLRDPHVTFVPIVDAQPTDLRMAWRAAAPHPPRDRVIALALALLDPASRRSTDHGVIAP